MKPWQSTVAGLNILKTDSSQTVIGYDGAKGEVYVDRRNSGNVSFHKDFPSIDSAPARLVDGKISLTIFVDQSLIEVFINGGEQVITSQVFPKGKGSAVELFSNDGAAVDLKVWEMKSIW